MTIYLIRNVIDGKVYIGQTTQPVEKRWRQHIQTFEHGSGALYRAMRSYGSENFSLSILMDGINTREDLDRLERQFIRSYDSQHPSCGYNRCDGGQEWSRRSGRRKITPIFSNIASLTDDQQLLTEGELSQLLCVSKGVLRKWRTLRQPPTFLKFGKSIRYEPEAIREFKRQSQVR